MSIEKIEWIPIDNLKPYERNARLHSESQIKKIAASIKEFGFNNPILIDENNGIIAGHGRLEAAKLLESQEVPTVRLSHLNDSQKRAYVIADNKIALDSTWDDDLLQSELAELSALDFDITLTGFESPEVFEPNLPDEDDEPKEAPSAFMLRVTFENEDEQQGLFVELRDRGFKVKV
jgi:ParB-like chromosome segregation protein Spo0J